MTIFGRTLWIFRIPQNQSKSLPVAYKYGLGRGQFEPRGLKQSIALVDPTRAQLQAATRRHAEPALICAPTQLDARPPRRLEIASQRVRAVRYLYASSGPLIAQRLPACHAASTKRQAYERTFDAKGEAPTWGPNSGCQLALRRPLAPQPIHHRFAFAWCHCPGEAAQEIDHSLVVAWRHRLGEAAQRVRRIPSPGRGRSCQEGDRSFSPGGVCVCGSSAFGIRNPLGAAWLRSHDLRMGAPQLALRSSQCHLGLPG